MYSRSERGLSEVLGAILVFALVVSGLALFQVNAVPAANEGVEFDHSRAVQQDLLDVDARVSSTAALGSSQSAVVETGVTYPNRFLFVNPGPASGSLAAEPAPFTIRHANATGETGDYWNGTDRSFESQRIVYRPAYNHYDGPVTALEAGVVYNTFDNGEVLQVDRGAFISGNRISLVAVTGDLSGTSGDSVAIELVPLSVPTRSISVTNATDESVVIRLTTDLDASTWATFLADEMASGHVVNVSTGPGGTVDIVLEQGVTYELRLAKVAVGSGDGTEPVAYVTHRDGLDTSIPGSGGTVAVVAHDRFNNPVSGVDMTFTSSQGTFGGVGSTTATTDASGVASATFTPDANLTRSNVSAGIDRNGDGSLSDESSEAYVSYELTVLTSSTDYRASEINPDETTGSIVWTDANVVKKNKSPGQIDVKFENTGDTKTAIGLRVSFYAPIGDPGKPKNVHSNVSVTYPGGITNTSTVGGPFIDFGSQDVLIDSSPVYLRLEFDDDVSEGDLVGVTLLFDDGSRARYFVQPFGEGALIS